jgi:hypothetical protein
MPRLPLQDEPESTVGRKPGRGFEHRVSGEGTPVRSGASIRREEGDESEAGSDIRDRDAGDGPEYRGLEE